MRSGNVEVGEVGRVGFVVVEVAFVERGTGDDFDGLEELRVVWQDPATGEEVDVEGVPEAALRIRVSISVKEIGWELVYWF